VTFHLIYVSIRILSLESITYCEKTFFLGINDCDSGRKFAAIFFFEKKYKFAKRLCQKRYFHSMADQKILPLRGAIQHYDWGGFDFISDLVGIENVESEPFAELWMGTHASAPSQVIQKEQVIPLHQWIAKAPEVALGEKVINHFGKTLPYLFKILDVRKMLSIQAHPDKDQAWKGFKRENDRGIPLDAPNRTYKDTNHKPEIMVALTDFWLLHGFRSIWEIERTLRETPEFASLRTTFKDHNIQQLYRSVMEMPQSEVDDILEPLQERLENAVLTDKKASDYWAARAFQDHPRKDGGCDRGIFSIYWLNIVHLFPGEGIYQGAGVPHAYMEGVNVELMANSDNVFRGGLTPKHIDVPELLKSLVFEPVTPQILQGEQISPTERVYFTPAPDFELSEITLSDAQLHSNKNVYAPEIFIVLDGEAEVNHSLTFKKGDIFLVLPGATYEIRPDEPTILYKATIP